MFKNWQNNVNFYLCSTAMVISSVPLTNSITQSLWAPPWSAIADVGHCSRQERNILFFCNPIDTNVESVCAIVLCQELFWQVHPVHPSQTIIIVIFCLFSKNEVIRLQIIKIQINLAMSSWLISTLEFEKVDLDEVVKRKNRVTKS